MDEPEISDASGAHPQGWLERKLEELLNSPLTDTQRLQALIYLTGELAKELRVYQKAV